MNSKTLENSLETVSDQWNAMMCLMLTHQPEAEAWSKTNITFFFLMNYEQKDMIFCLCIRVDVCPSPLTHLVSLQNQLTPLVMKQKKLLLLLRLAKTTVEKLCWISLPFANIFYKGLSRSICVVQFEFYIVSIWFMPRSIETKFYILNFFGSISRAPRNDLVPDQQYSI